jgi:hypothetical protein
MPDGSESRTDQNWWQRAVRSAPGQAARWLAVLGLVIWRWQSGVPRDFTGWLPVLIVAVVLLLPDAESVAFGGVRIEMRRTREEIAGLRQQVMQMQITQASAVGPVFGNDAIEALFGLGRRVAEGEESGVAPRERTPRPGALRPGQMNPGQP